MHTLPTTSPRGGSPALSILSRKVARGLVFPLLAGTVVGAMAAAPAPILSGSGWAASTFFSPDVAAFAPYPNAVTMPDPSTTDAKLMWYWGAGNYVGTPSGTNGPNVAQFEYRFNLDDKLTGIPSGAWIAADDFMALTINGTPFGTYRLDEHKLGNNQPDPVYIRFPDSDKLWKQGQNSIGLFAYDGFTYPQNRLYEWAFFDAKNGADHKPVFMTPVPEPSTWALVLAGLAGIGFMQGRRRRE